MTSVTAEDLIRKRVLRKINFSQVIVNHNGKVQNAQITEPNLLGLRYGDFGDNYEYVMTIECCLSEHCGEDNNDVRICTVQGDIICRVKFESDINGNLKDIKTVEIKDDTLFITIKQ